MTTSHADLAATKLSRSNTRIVSTARFTRKTQTRGMTSCEYMTGGKYLFTHLHGEEICYTGRNYIELITCYVSFFSFTYRFNFKYIYRDMFPCMFIVLLTHSNNSEIISLAWGQMLKKFSM